MLQRAGSNWDQPDGGIECAEIIRVGGDDILIASAGADHDVRVGDAGRSARGKEDWLREGVPGTVSQRLSAAEPWSHNVHYHAAILAAVPDGCRRALDVGCGTGALTRRLRRVVPQVTGIDRDARSIELARSHPGARGVSYVLGDFRAPPFGAESFDLITAVASLHHMDAAAALERMRELLRPGGVLAVIGLARGISPADLGLLVPAMIGDRLHRLAAARDRRRSPGGGIPGDRYQPPIVWPPPTTYRDIRRLAGHLLPGARYRRHLYWRYSLTWTKPARVVTPGRRAGA